MKRFIDKWLRFRVSLVFFCFLLAFAGLFARAYYLQIVQHDTLIKKAKRQRSRSVVLTPKRGFIYDTNNEILAASIEVGSIYANPKKIKNANQTARSLSKILNISRKKILRKIKKKNNPFVWLKRKVFSKEIEKLKEAKLEGVYTVKESKRYYPNFNLASHVLGFAGMDSKGLEGLELKYDQYIRGDRKMLYSEQDARGNTVSVKASTSKWEDGCDLYLTIDKNIQDITETQLKKAVIEHEAKSGIAIVQEPMTGKILALASYPDFNPNRFSKFKNQNYRNKAIYSHFDPGSTFKAFVVAAALEDEAIEEDDEFDCENGSYYVNSVRIGDTKKHKIMSVKDIVRLSSNIGAIKIGEKLGKEKLHGYLEGFGFGKRSGIDLPAESSGLLRNYSSWNDVDLANVSFGHGISATALQLVNGFSTIANGGKRMRPYVVEKIMTKEKSVVKEFSPEVKEQVISKKTAEIVTDFLVSVVQEKGTGTRAAIDNYSVAGKTGTAQVYDAELKQYSNDKYLSSFIGFAPAQEPVVTVGVFIEEPQNGHYGGTVAAPAFKNIVSEILNLKGVMPSYSNAEVKVPPTKKRTVKKKARLKRATRKVKFASANDNAFVMPDFEGLSLRHIAESFTGVDLELILTGSGKAVEQFPEAGEIIRKGKEVYVRCASSL